MTKAGHIVVYNCGEESLFQCKLACERLDLKNDFMVAEETMLPKLLTFMDNVKKANPKKQVFLLQDSLATLDDGRYVDSKGESRGTTGKTPGYCAEALVDWTQQNYTVTIFIGQVTKGDVFAGQNKIRHAIDVHAHLYYDEQEKSDTYGCLMFETTKNRWGVSGVTHILKLEKTGLSEVGHFTKGK
jgi:predicted ATP-dependent serine protease